MADNQKKHLWLIEIANSFGMNISQFSKCIGYSRQSLYSASSGFVKLRKAHVGMACFKLGVLSEKILTADIQSAKERHETRKKLIRDFEKRLIAEEA